MLAARSRCRLRDGSVGASGRGAVRRGHESGAARPAWIPAFDTSTRAGSAALARDGEVVAAAVGDPSRTHGERLAERLGPDAGLVDDPPPLARIAFEHPGRRVAPHAAQPLYVRRPDAVVARERRS